MVGTTVTLPQAQFLNPLRNCLVCDSTELRPVLERMYGEKVREDVYGRLIRESYAEALRDEHIHPVGQPEIVTESAEPGGDLRYSATLEVVPEIDPVGWEGLDVERMFRGCDCPATANCRPR